MEFNEVKVIQTKRLTLTILNRKDVDIVFALRSNEEVIRYIVREPLEIWEAEQKIQELLKYLDTNESISWIINLNSEAEKIGSICLWNFSADRKTAEVGYDLLPEYHNKGIMNEALQSVLHFGFHTLQLEIIEAFTSKHNKSSIALLEKNNFKFQRERIDEGFPDNSVFSLTL